MPPTLGSTEAGYPAWVSAESLLDERGELAVGKVAPEYRQGIQELISDASRRSCEPRGDLVRQTAPRPDLFAAVEASQYIFVGTVTGKDSGFYHSVPGTLYRMVVDRTLRGESGRAEERFFFLPVADFIIRERRICFVIASYPRYLPEAGDQVLLLLEAKRVDRNYSAISGATHWVVLPRSGGVSLPRNYLLAHREIEGSDPKAFLSWIEKMVEQ